MKNNVIPILESESLQRAKQKYLQSNQRFVSAVNKVTSHNYNALERKLLLSSLHIQAIENYTF